MRNIQRKGSESCSIWLCSITCIYTKGLKKGRMKSLRLDVQKNRMPLHGGGGGGVSYGDRSCSRLSFLGSPRNSHRLVLPGSEYLDQLCQQHARRVLIYRQVWSAD